MRQLMYWSMVVAGAFSLWNVVFSRARWMAGLAFAMLAVTLALGGTEVQLGYFPDDKRYVGLDWLFLDFLGSTLTFVFIEKLFALRAQPLFRSHGQTDAQHFFGQPSGGGLCCARD